MPAKKKLIDEAAVTIEVIAPHAHSGNRLVTVEDLAADAAFLDDEADGHMPAAPLGGDRTDMPKATATEEPEAEAEAQQQQSRGSVTALVKELLADPDLSYEAIVEQVKASYPDARTTARSVASTASVMRRKGTTVPTRRSPKPD